MFCSFVLPAYKSDFLRSSISSILNQTETDFELVIINDASPYDLDSIINTFSDSRIKYFKNEINIGGNSLVSQWNKCLSYASGDYVVLASDDDRYSPDYLSEMKYLVHLHPGKNVYSTRKFIIDENDNVVDVDGYLGEYMSSVDYVSQLFSSRVYSSISNYMFNRRKLVELGGFVDFPVAWYSDDAIVIKMANDGIVVSPKCLFFFRFSGQNLSTIKNPEVFNKKLIATSQFYFWFEKEKNNMRKLCQIDELLYRHLDRKLIEYLQYKTRLLISEGGWPLFLKTLKKRHSLPFVTNSWLIKSFISLIRNNG